MIVRRWFPGRFGSLACLAAGFLALVCSGAARFADAQPTRSPDRPNVLMICVDDLKPTIGCFGDAVAVTPHLDRLAGRGVRFDAAYCNQAVCAPSRNSLMTGLRPQTIGVYDLGTHFRSAAPDVVTLGGHFIAAGYHARSLGKIFHTGHGNYDDVPSWSQESWRPKAPRYVNEVSLNQIKPDSRGRKLGPATEAADVDDETYGDGMIARRAARDLEKLSQTAEQPFFLAVGFFKPHLPFVAPQKYWDLYDPQSLPMPTVTRPPAGAPDYAPTNFGELRSYSDMPAMRDLNAAEIRRLIHGYYAATSYTDAQIGHVLDKLDELQLTDKTIVVLWGDHGWHLGDHGMWCKHTNYEQAARIPLIVAAPDADAGRGSDALVETVDLFPTLADLAGIASPGRVDGKSFAATVRDAKAPARPYITHVYPRGRRLGRAIRDDRYRMVQWKEFGVDEGPVDIELYDYETDPLETENIAADRPDVVERMLGYLAEQPEPKPQWQNQQ